MQSRRLEYQSLQTVLQHMEANVRFRISLQMPSIRQVEKLVPLKMNRLKMYDCNTEINETSYYFGIIRHYPDGSEPEPNKEDPYGSDRDVDEFGCPIRNNDVLLPGDISLRRENHSDDESEYETEEYHRGSLRVHTKAHEIRMDLKSKGLTEDDYHKRLEPNPEDEFDEEFRWGFKYTLDMLNFFIEQDKYNLQPFDCRRDNTKPPFSCYIQLAIRKSENRLNIEQMHRFVYNKKLHEAVKYFNKFLFDGRRTPVQVDTLDLSYCSSENEIIRLPVGFRVTANKVRASSQTVTHNNFPVLVENSENLDSLWILGGLDQKTSQSIVVRNAKRVTIAKEGHFGIRRRGQVAEIGKLPNREISIMLTEPSDFDDVAAESLYFQMIQAWLSGDRRIGASCCIGMGREKTAKGVLRMLQAQYENTEQTDRCVTIHRNDFTKVEAFYFRLVGLEQVSYDSAPGWVLKTSIAKA